MFDIFNVNPQKRYDAHFLDGMPLSSIASQTIKTALNLFPVVAQNSDGNDLRATPKVHRLFSVLAQIGRLGTLGEKRGIDILGVRSDPGQCLIEAAGMMAEIVQINSRPAAPAVKRARVAIVTGFTVVDENGQKICGENDGPPGAVILASTLLSQGIPVTLVIDSGAESSLISALIAADLVRISNNDRDARERNTGDVILNENLEIHCIPHGPEFGNSHNSDIQVQQCIKALKKKNTLLVIAIERPSPNVSGDMASMSGASIKKFNADMSPLFEQDLGWKTIGIGDGGNEIGTAGAKAAVTRARKPDGTLIVNNGDKIAALAETDVMVLSSVSNNGGLFLSVSFELILAELNLNRNIRSQVQGETAHASQDLIRKMCSSYISMVIKMFNEKMSMDGVKKVNALTVDGRRLLRGYLADGVRIDPPQALSNPGDPTATHEDMFDIMHALIKNSGISLYNDGFFNGPENPPTGENLETFVQSILDALDTQIQRRTAVAVRPSIPFLRSNSLPNLNLPEAPLPIADPRLHRGGIGFEHPAPTRDETEDGMHE